MTQPEALRLADALDAHQFDEPHAAAAELRRLHAQRDELLGALAKPVQEPDVPEANCGDMEPVPVGWLENPFGSFRRNWLWQLDPPPRSLAWSIPLYATPQRPAEPVQAPVGVVTSMVKGGVTWHRWPGDMPDGTTLYTAPPQRKQDQAM